MPMLQIIPISQTFVIQSEAKNLLSQVLQTMHVLQIMHVLQTMQALQPIPAPSSP